MLITAEPPSRLLFWYGVVAFPPLQILLGSVRRDSTGGRMEPMHNIPARGGLNFDETPFLAIWEVTQSCDLACKNCRAAAQPIAHPDELSNAEGKALIDQISDMHIPIFVFTGGD